MNTNEDSSISRRDLIRTAALVGTTTVITGAPRALAQMQGSASKPASEAQARGIASDDTFRLYDPEGLPPSVGYSQVAEVRRGRIVYIAGQVPRTPAGEMVSSNDFRAQLEQVFANLDTAVRATGGTFANVVKLNYFCVASVEPAQQRHIVEVRDRFVNTQSPPVSTFVFVSRLVRPEWLIEIEAVVVLPPLASAVVVLAQIDFDSPRAMQQGLELARGVAERTRSEDGCLHYAYGADVNVPTRLQLSEWWRDESSLITHLHSPHLRDFRRALRRLGSKSTVKRYDVGTVGDLVLPPLEP